MKILKVILLLVFTIVGQMYGASKSSSKGSVYKQKEITAKYRINAGGKKLTTSRGVFSKDGHYNLLSLARSTSKAIAATTDDALYQTQRWGLKTLNYTLPISNGKYTVILHFAEFDYSKAGRRIFDVSLEGKRVINDLDIAAKVGSFTAHIETFTVKVIDGAMSINLSALSKDGGKDNPVISGIEIINAPTSTPPVLATSIPGQNASVGAFFSYTFPVTTFKDIDNDPLTYSCKLQNGVNLPSWLKFNGATRTLSGTAPSNSPSLLAVRISAADGSGGTANADFLLNINHSPVVGVSIPGGVAVEKTPYIYTFPQNAFSDADQDSLMYAAVVSGSTDPEIASSTSLPWWIEFDGSTRTFTANVPEYYPMPYRNNFTIEIAIIASDGKGGQAISNFNLSILTINDTPTIKTPFPDQFLEVGGSFQLNINRITYFEDKEDLLYLICDPAIIEGPATFTYKTPVNKYTDGYGIAHTGDVPVDIPMSIIARDTKGATVTAYFTLHIFQPSNSKPIVTNSIPDQVVGKGINYTYSLPSETFYDQDNDVLNYTARQYPTNKPLPAWLNFDGSTITFSGTPPIESNTILTIEVTADDNISGSASTTFILRTNSIPVVSTPIPDQTLLEGEFFNYTFPEGTFSDSDNDPLTYAIGFPCPEWLTFEPESRTLSGYPPMNGSNTISLVILASDNISGTILEYFDIHIVGKTKGIVSLANKRTTIDETKTFNENKTIVTAYPNPFVANFNLRIEGKQGHEYMIKIKDLLGRELYSQEYKSFAGENSDVNIDLSKENYSHSSVFLVTVEDKNKTMRKVIRVIKN